MLSNAEREKVLKVKKKKTPELEEERNKLREEEKKYLNAKIIKAERKKPFKVRTHMI
jgi:hypothetical protein